MNKIMRELAKLWTLLSRLITEKIKRKCKKDKYIEGTWELKKKNNYRTRK